MAGRVPNRSGDAEEDAALADHLDAMRRKENNPMPASARGPLDGAVDNPDAPSVAGVVGLTIEELAAWLKRPVADLLAAPTDALARRARRYLEEKATRP
ncbi:hypothetical protein [Nisaea sp.]